MKTALIVGVSGQDGAYLSDLLLRKNYRVIGTSRTIEPQHLWRLQRLGISGQVELETLQPGNAEDCIGILRRIEPDEVYNLAAQSSVSLSFQKPLETYNSICPVVANLLDAVRTVNRGIRLYNAGSGEVFGEGAEPFSETSPMLPRSPYGAAKMSAQLLARSYREIYGLHCCTGILFNHESPLRDDFYVTKKIVAGALAIANGRQTSLRLGNLDIHRDWGWAPEYVEAMWLMLQQPEPDDYIIATGHYQPLRSFADIAFSYFGLDYRDYLEVDKTLFRPMDIEKSTGDNRRAATRLNWKPKLFMADVVRLMVQAEQELEARGQRYPESDLRTAILPAMHRCRN